MRSNHHPENGPTRAQHSPTTDPFARDPARDTGEAGTRFMLDNRFTYLYEQLGAFLRPSEAQYALDGPQDSLLGHP